MHRGESASGNEKVYLLFKGNASMQSLVGAYTTAERALAMALFLTRNDLVTTIKLDVHQLNVPIPIVMPRKRK